MQFYPSFPSVRPSRGRKGGSWKLSSFPSASVTPPIPKQPITLVLREAKGCAFLAGSKVKVPERKSSASSLMSGPSRWLAGGLFSSDVTLEWAWSWKCWGVGHVENGASLSVTVRAHGRRAFSFPLGCFGFGVFFLLRLHKEIIRIHSRTDVEAKIFKMQQDVKWGRATETTCNLRHLLKNSFYLLYLRCFHSSSSK